MYMIAVSVPELRRHKQTLADKRWFCVIAVLAQYFKHLACLSAFPKGFLTGPGQVWIQCGLCAR
jgi:hypothetical protein